MHMTTPKRRVSPNQQGMVAIVTVMILMIVISLIVLGFSQIVRRNTRQVIDAQLSSQAFYAAESGLNLAAARIAANDSTYVNKTDCTGPANDYKVSADGQTVITCLLTHLPDHLQFDGVDSTSRVSLVKRSDNAPIGNLTVTWQNAQSGANVTGCSGASIDLPTAGGWGCNQPVLRIDLVPVSNTNNNRDNLIANQHTTFLYPKSSGGSSSTAWSSSVGNNKGNIVRTQCTNTPSGIDRKCKVTISGMSGNQYAIRMTSLYHTSEVIVYASGRPELVGGQVVVDSTARSLDVVKRIRARVPVNSNLGVIPDFAIDSGDGICKAYKVVGGNVDIESSGNSPYVGCRLP